MNFRFAMLLLLAAAVWPQHKLAPLDESGYRAMLKSNAGSVVLVDFWATWCAPCRKEMPLLAKLDGRLRQKRFHLITVSADEPEK
jgi:thiol-disulfide isomerase/thioredoxin